MYNRVLSADELQCISNSNGRDAIVDNLLVRLRMDEYEEGHVASGAGSVCDSGPLALHGTPNGSCTYGPSRNNLVRPML